MIFSLSILVVLVRSTLPNPTTTACVSIRQCAAVSTHCSPMIEPPQKPIVSFIDP